MEKVRMQILLDEDQKKALEKEAKSTGHSIGELIRESILLRYQLKSEEEPILTARDPLWDFVGSFRSKKGDLSEDHDRYLY